MRFVAQLVPIVVVPAIPLIASTCPNAQATRLESLARYPIARLPKEGVGVGSSTTGIWHGQLLGRAVFSCPAWLCRFCTAWSGAASSASLQQQRLPLPRHCDDSPGRTWHCPPKAVVAAVDFGEASARATRDCRLRGVGVWRDASGAAR